MREGAVWEEGNERTGAVLKGDFAGAGQPSGHTDKHERMRWTGGVACCAPVIIMLTGVRGSVGAEHSRDNRRGPWELRGTDDGAWHTVQGGILVA